MKTNQSRRRFLAHAGALAGGIVGSNVYSALTLDGRLARAQSMARPFVLYIHCGSWDGIASGLLQPNALGAQPWPLGVFRNGVKMAAPNPLIDQISAHGNMKFHRYNKVLSEILGDLFHATITSRSLDHSVAALLQRTGHEAGHPSWTAALAQATPKQDLMPSLVAGTGMRLNAFTPNVAAVNAGSLGQFRASFQDPLASGLSPTAKARFGAAASAIFQEKNGSSLIPGYFKSAFDGSHNYWSRGIPELAESTPLITGLRQALSVQRANALIDTHMGDNDAAEIKQRYNNFAALRENLVLAGALAKSGIASGMDITLPSEDYHEGGSQVWTARSACQLWSQLTLFWKWVQEQGMANDVLVIVSHEFSRTRFNGALREISATINGQVRQIECPGTDHGLTAGMYLLNGRLPGGSRYGGIIDTYDAAGSASLNGAPQASIPPATSLQVVATALLKCFPDVFRNEREPQSTRNLRLVFPNIEDSDIIQPLLGAS